MPADRTAATSQSFSRFGQLLRFLRRRARLTQRELAIEVGYSEVHISRFEGQQRPPDEQTLLALFVPALDLADEPALVAQLLELARRERGEARPLAPLLPAVASAATAPASPGVDPLEPLPLLPGYAVARKEALAWLREQLLAERAVAVCGMPGIGKTTLVAALALERAASVPVFWLTLTPGVTATVEVVLRQLALFLALHGQAQVAQLLQSRDGAQGGLALDQQVALVSAALGRLAWDQLGQRDAAYGGLPLLCFDNVPPDDPTVLQVLGHLLASTPVALLLTSRSDVVVPGVVSIRPPALGEAEGLELIARLGVTLERPVAERLLARTGGSPMLIRLALGQLRQQRAEPEQFVAQLEHQPQIAAYLVDTLLRGLPAGVWRLVSLVAVFRQPVNLYDAALIELIRAGDEPYAIGDAIAEAQRRHLFDLPGAARLHPLVRDQIAAQLATDGGRKRLLHRIAGEWSEQAGVAVEAAYHYACADDVERAVEVLTDHAAGVVGSGYALAAAAVLDTVLPRIRRRRDAGGGLMRHVLSLYGDLVRDTPRAAEAEACYRQALALTTQPTVAAQIGARLARCLVARGGADEALEVAQAARAALPPSHPLLLAQLAAAESAAQLALGSFPAALAAAEVALAAADQLQREQTAPVAEVRALALTALGLALCAAQRFEPAAAALERAIGAARAGGLAQMAQRCVVELVRVLALAGDFAAALARGNSVVPELRTATGSYALAPLLSVLSQSALALDDPQMALAHAEQACSAAEAVGDQPALAAAQLDRISVLTALGRAAEARTLAERVVLLARAAGLPALEGGVLLRQARLALLDGSPAQAVVLLERALAAARVARAAALELDATLLLRFARCLAGSPPAATEPDVDLPGAVDAALLERTLLRGATLLASAQPALAQALADAVLTRTAGTQHRSHAAAARRLQSAIHAAAPPAALPALMWVAASPR